MRNKKFDEVLRNYVDSLDNENENRKLLLELEDASKTDSEIKKYYEEAKLHQHLYFQRMARKREPIILAELMERVKRRKRNNIEKGCSNCKHFRYGVPMRSDCWFDPDLPYWEESRWTLREKWINFIIQTKYKLGLRDRNDPSTW